MSLLSEARRKLGKRRINKKIKKQVRPRQVKMARKSKGKKTTSKGKQGSNLINKIPIIRDIVGNPIVRKATLATGTVSLLAGLASLVPIPQIQSIAQNPIARTGTAFLIGDAEGAALQFVSDRGGLASLINIGAQQTNGSGAIASTGAL